VTPSGEGTLFAQHYTLDDGSEAQVLDLIKIEVTKADPQVHQPENWVIRNTRWKLLTRRISVQHMKLIARAIESGPALFGDYGDRIDFGRLCKKPTMRSLCLIKPEELWWKIKTSYTGRRQTRAVFSISGQPYDLVITDPVWKQRLSFLDYGDHKLIAAKLERKAEILFTISLGEPMPSDKQCYKLVAGVILLERGM
jgi:hypothetical protein